MGIYTTAIEKLYVAYFNRPADVAGLTFWEGVVAKANGSTAAVSAEFAKSAEYKAAYAGMDEYHVVAQVYQNLFGRAPEPAGLNFWGQALINKAMTIDNVVTQIAAGAQGSDLVAYNNKVAAATAFTAALDTSAEILAYSGDKANAVAKQFISGITDDASLKAAIAEANLNAVVQSVVDNGPQPAGQTFTLTQGMDTIVGTTGNDTINVYAFNPATGGAATNLSTFDSIDGSAGKDTLNLTMTDANNTTIVGTVKNVEIINIDQSAMTTAANVDASVFAGATIINQMGKAGNVTGLAAGTTAGFTGITAGALSVAAAGATAAVSLTNVVEDVTLAVSGSTLAGVTVSGTRVDGADAGTGVSALTLGVTAGKDVKTVTVNTAVATTLTVNENAANTAGVNVTTVDASASAGAITFSADAATTTIMTGAGADSVTVATATSAATDTAPAVGATVGTGAGNDTVTVNTTGNGVTSIDTGAGNDTVNVTARGTKLVVSLGDGADTFTSAVAVTAADSIDAGAGTDTLALSLVGSANIGAFSNFDVFDAVGLGKNLDVDILATKNTVSEFVASGNTGNWTLSNVGAGVGFRATGDMTGGTLAINQKVAGALTITVDGDETATADTAADAMTANVATNATSINAVFDTAFKASITGEATAAAGDNWSTLNLTASATSVSVAAGGTLAHDILNYTEAAAAALTSITVTGDRDLSINTVGTTKLATIDASAATGGLMVSTNALKDGGTIKLGSGVDVITVGSNSTAAGIESVSGFEKAAAVAVSAVAADADAAAAAQADADVLFFAANASVADANATVTTGTIAKGVLTFTGSGPSDLASAIAIADAAAETAGETVVFEYLGNSYVFQQSGGAADTIVKLVGITGVTNLGEVGTSDQFFLV